MSDLFVRGDTYDDNGNLNINNNYTEMDKYCKLTFTLGSWTSASAITNMFNWESSDYFYSVCSAGGVNEATIVFDLDGKKHIKSILLCALFHLEGGIAANYSIKIQGSNDNSAYTDLATQTGSDSPDSIVNLSCGDFDYKYIRLYYAKTDAGDGDISVSVYSLKILV